MILDLDIGHSRVSWLINDDKYNRLGNAIPIKRGVANDFAEFKEQIESSLASRGKVMPLKLQRIRIGCVLRDSAKSSKWLKQIKDTFIPTESTDKSKNDIRVDIAQVYKKQSGVIIAYEDPQSLGVDRWLALLAAYNDAPNETWLIIDAGTAVTIDLMDKGNHMGGLIVPGLELLHSSFYNKTSIPQPSYVKDNLFKEASLKSISSKKWGVDTESCLSIGSLFMITSFIDHITYDFLTEFPTGKIILTGGYGKALYNKLVVKINKKNINYDSHLVCRGLSYAFVL